MPIKAYKGFDKKLSCRGFVYEIGKQYELPEGQEPIACECGFHACPNPADLFSFYPPNDGNRYCEVELSGMVDDTADDKLCASRIRIVRELTITELANAHREYVNAHLINDNEHTASNTGNRSSASNTGYYSSASNTGDYSSASNTGNRSSASNTGNRSSAEVSGKGSIAAVFGKDSKARGSLGSALFLTERGEWDGETYPILNVLAVLVDGKEVKADTWYMLKNGKLEEV